jgi:hypothetical protein
MRRRSALGAVTAGLCVLTLVGCTVPRSGPTDEGIEGKVVMMKDLSEVKADVLAWTSSLVATVPPGVVESSWQNDEGSLLSCSETSWTWSSAAEITMTDEQDLVPYLKVMADSWSTEDGYSASFEKTGLGNPRLMLVEPGGGSISVDARGDRRRLAFTSFSACVTDLADYKGGPSY